MAKSVCVSIDDDVWQLGKDKNLSWHECLTYGIKQLAYNYKENPEDTHLQTIENETPKAELEKLKRALFQVQEFCLQQADFIEKKGLKEEFDNK